MAVQTKIQLRRDTAANWTSTNPTLAAGEIGFETDTGKFKIGTGALAWTNASLKYSQDASLLSGTASITALTTSGSVTVGGNLTVNGTTTSINSSTLQVDDKNLELGSVAGVAGIVANVENGSGEVTTSTAYNFIIGQSVTRTAGAAYAGGSIIAIASPTTFTVSGTFGATGTATLTIGGADDNTADGAGITVKGNTDKTFNYTNATTSWTSNQDLNLVTGKVYEINGSTVLSSTQVLGKSITDANTISTIVARDGSGNFAAGTITASLTGTASLATNLAGGSAGQLLYQSAANVTAELAVTATNNQVLSYNTATNAPQWTAITGTGNVVYSTSPVLTTPNIGVPSFATLTNATGLPVATGISGLGTGVNTALTVNTGSAGAFVVNGGALGTPSGGTLTNATGLPISTGVSGLGTNVATFLATPSSANFLNAVTGATGNGGGVVFANNATLVAPTLGVATATSLNKVTVTAPATAATLTLADGSTLATSGAFSVTLTGTATTNVTLPTSGTLATQTYVGSATVAQANNLTGTTPNLIPYQSASNTTTFLAAPAGNNYVLSANTTGAPYWAAATATGVTNVSAGTGMSFTAITSTGSVSIDTAVVPRFNAAGTFTTLQTFQNSSNATAGLYVKNHATQQVNPFEVQYSNGTAMVSVSNTGTLFAVTIDGGSA
jgi:hypothetical protein